MAEAFRMGGWAMVPTLLMGLGAIGAALRYARSPEPRFVPLQVSLGLMTLLSGSLGLVTGVIRSLGGLPRVTPDERWIWMLGLGESLHNVALALALLVLAAILTSVGALRAARLMEAATGGAPLSAPLR